MTDTMLNLDELLDSSMEDVETAPDYVEPENGVYILKVAEAKIEQGSITDPAKVQKAKDEGKPTTFARLRHTYSIEQVISQEQGTPIKPGSMFSDQWMASKESGLPYFKARTIAIAVANGEDGDTIGKLSIREMLEGVTDLSFRCVIKKTPRSDNSGRFNIRVEQISEPTAE